MSESDALTTPAICGLSASPTFSSAPSRALTTQVEPSVRSIVPRTRTASCATAVALREPSTTPASPITIILSARIRFLRLIGRKDSVGKQLDAPEVPILSTARQVRCAREADASGVPRMRAEDDHDAWILYSLN